MSKLGGVFGQSRCGQEDFAENLIIPIHQTDHPHPAIQSPDHVEENLRHVPDQARAADHDRFLSLKFPRNPRARKNNNRSWRTTSLPLGRPSWESVGPETLMRFSLHAKGLGARCSETSCNLPPIR